jgi:hypothetical protein
MVNRMEVHARQCEEGFMLAGLARVTDVAYEAVHATGMHARRIAGAVSTALARVTREVGDLVWDYRDMAGDLRRPPRGESHVADVDPVDLRQPPDASPGGAKQA